MSSEVRARVGAALAEVSAVMAERRRQEGLGKAGPFPFYNECLAKQAKALRYHGHTGLADALDGLRDDGEGNA